MPRTIAAPELLTKCASGQVQCVLCACWCVLADVALAGMALADVALEAWYMRLQSTNFWCNVEYQHSAWHPLCRVDRGSLLVNMSQLIWFAYMSYVLMKPPTSGTKESGLESGSNHLPSPTGGNVWWDILCQYVINRQEPSHELWGCGGGTQPDGHLLWQPHLLKHGWRASGHQCRPFRCGKFFTVCVIHCLEEIEKFALFSIHDGSFLRRQSWAHSLLQAQARYCFCQGASLDNSRATGKACKHEAANTTQLSFVSVCH